MGLLLVSNASGGLHVRVNCTAGLRRGEDILSHRFSSPLAVLFANAHFIPTVIEHLSSIVGAEFIFGARFGGDPFACPGSASPDYAVGLIGSSKSSVGRDGCANREGYRPESSAEANRTARRRTAHWPSEASG